jgi:hypothetical protein
MYELKIVIVGKTPTRRDDQTRRLETSLREVFTEITDVAPWGREQAPHDKATLVSILFTNHKPEEVVKFVQSKRFRVYSLQDLVTKASLPIHDESREISRRRIKK